MEKIEKLIKYQEQIENINIQQYNLEREVNLLFDEIQANLTETVMFEEPIIVKENSDFSAQTYTTTIFGLTKDELLSVADDLTHLTFAEIDEKDLTESVFDYIILEDKIYLLEHIIDNLKN